MFKNKCVVIMYRASTNTATYTGSYYMTGRFVSYTTLFLAAKEQLNNKFGEDFAITNIIKL